ncbi:hypothetical protein [Bacillus massilinigeriensis]|uniref:hypothetical protein n=1 Tax=Bacillus mediterraneensis TaxID=1805474 RepID=UPI0008F84255|nr:hypothetical protein [Bacillus mediterraneensis]
MRKRYSPTLKLLLICFSFLVLAAIFYKFISLESQAERAVEQFYQEEQEGNYSESWELLHPLLKEKFPKAVFIQDRTHVFMGHFGADTFSYSIESAGKVKNWRIEAEGKKFADGFRFLVTQSYKGKYGIFHFQQEVIVVQEDGDMLLLWDYN